MTKKAEVVVVRLVRLVALLLIMAYARNAHAQTLLEQARAHDPSKGPLFVTISGMTPARTVAELVPESDLVVHGLVVAAIPELNDAQTAIVTRLTVQPLRELASRRTEGRPTDARGNLPVRQLGGRLEIGGRTVIVNDGQLDSLGVGEQVLLFLKLNQERTFYEILYAPYGCLRVRDGRVEAIGAPARIIHRDVEGRDIAAVAAQIREIAAVR